MQKKYSKNTHSPLNLLYFPIMNLISSALRHFLCYTIIFSGISQAQGDLPPVKKKTTYRVCCLGDWTKGDIYSKTDKRGAKPAYKKLDVMDMGYSADTPFKRAKPIKFYKLTDDEETPYQEVHSVIIPQGIKTPLILLIPTKDKLLHRVYDIDPTVFPYGSFQMVNFSKMNLKVGIDDDIRPLKPKASQQFAPLKAKKKAAWLRIADAQTNAYVFTSMIMRRQAKRVIVFIVNSAKADGTQSVKTRMLVDFEPAKEPEQP